MNDGFNFLDELSAEPKFNFFLELKRLGFERIDNPQKDEDTHYRGRLYDYFSNSDPIVDIYRVEKSYSGAERAELVITKDDICIYRGLIPLSSFSFKFLMSQLFPSQEYVKHLEESSWNTIGNGPQPFESDYKLENNQQLINLLLHYGFKENTKTHYPEHYELSKRVNDDNPYNVKRSFVKGKLLLEFDYFEISIHYDSVTRSFKKNQFTVNELTSIIYFSNVSTDKRKYLYKLINENPDKLHYIYDELNNKYTLERLKGKQLEIFKKHQRSAYELKSDIITKLVKENI